MGRSGTVAADVADYSGAVIRRRAYAMRFATKENYEQVEGQNQGAIYVKTD